MKQEIEKEAKEYAYGLNEFPKNDFNNGQYSGFFAGVNSKCAERIKIEYAIGILHELLEEIAVGSKESKIISDKFQQLQNQLPDGK